MHTAFCACEGIKLDKILQEFTAEYIFVWYMEFTKEYEVNENEYYDEYCTRPANSATLNVSTH